MTITILFVTVGVLSVTLIMLALANRRLRYMKDETHFKEWAWANEKALRECGQILKEQLVVLYQVGELLDHAGVDLEHSRFAEEAEDLKRLGALLRQLELQQNPWSLDQKDPWTHEPQQALLSELGDKYGIEPPGRLYEIRQVIRISEEIFERVLASHKPVRPVALSA